VSIAIARGWQDVPPRPIFADMALFPPTSGPRAALADLTAFLRQRSREQVIGAALAVLVTIIILIIFIVDSKINTAAPSTVVFVEDYPATRTDADIRADQQKASEERRKAEEARRREFQKLEEKFGIE